MIFKVLIVDDEAIMRKGISNFMNWDSIDCEIVGTAKDGSEAISFIQRHNVDIVITDIKMPVADGLEVARFIQENKPEIKVILLTGYADFEYAKTAIKYNVSSFILKPTNKKDLYEAVKKAQEQLITSKKNSSIAKEELAFLKDQLLLEMTTAPYSSSFEPRLSKLNIQLDNYYAVAFQLVPLGNDISSLKKIIIDEKKNAYCYRYNNLIITIYFLAEHMDSIPQLILNNCREISMITHTLESKQIAIGISYPHSGASDFQLAVSEAIQALTLNFYSEDNIALFSESSKTKGYDLTAENALDLLEFENNLNNWQFDESNIIINNIFSKMKSNFSDSFVAKNMCSQIYYICYRVLAKKDTKTPSSDFLTQIHNSSDIFALENTIHALLLYTRNQFVGLNHIQNKLVDNTINFIHTHLDYPLSLETLSEHLHISPSHLSRTFKKTCNESLTEYINKTRIEKAKEYLLESDMLTYEIATIVGYNDATYFSSIFKKYTGLSPTDYRQKSST